MRKEFDINTLSSSRNRNNGLFTSLTFIILFQTSIVVIVQIAPVLAPLAAGDLDINAVLVGVLTSIIFFTALFSTFFTSILISKVGSLNTAIICLGFMILGTGTFSFATSKMELILAAIFVGIGYGPVNPIGSHVLSKVTPKEVRNFVFSFKQSSVSIGGALSGFLLPTIAIWGGWRVASASGLVFALIAICFVLPARKYHKADAEDSVEQKKIYLRQIVESLKNGTATQVLAISVFSFSMLQFGFMSIYVTMLWTKASVSSQFAGYMIGLTMAASIVGRLFWGRIADLGSEPRLILAIQALSGVFVLMIITTLNNDWSPIGIAVISLILGLGPMGWSGLLLAEIARIGSRTGGLTGVVTATSVNMVFAYLGGLLGPALLSLSAFYYDSYIYGLILLSLSLLLTAFSLLYTKSM